MQFAGAPSWRLESDNPQSLQLALYVRDAAGLVLPRAADVPPAVSAHVEPLTEPLPLPTREEAETQWLGWWRELIDSEVRFHEQPRTNAAEFAARRVASGLERRFDPPLFASLTDRPALHTAVLATMPHSLHWAGNSKGPQLGPVWTIDWAVIRDVVHEVAAAHGLRHEEIDGTVLVLAVTGHWAYHPAPGVAVCSLATATDPATAAPMLRRLLTPTPPLS